MALDSIIYAPLYFFVQKNSLNRNAQFHFYIEPVHTNIKAVPREKLRASLSIYLNLSSLRPIEDDPVFSPVCDKTLFDDWPRTWFGVGDPLRVRRLQIFKPSFIAYEFIGTLVSRLALWIIAERKCQLAPEYLSDFNYVTCHSRGMTGYYVTEALFRTKYNNPLAPVYAAGQEVDQISNFLSQDWERRIDEDSDPVWAAAVSTEIGRMLMLKQMNRQHPMQVKPLHEGNGFGGKLPNDFLFTAVVARKDEENSQEISDSTAYLRAGLIDAIQRLIDYPSEFCSVLAKFYRSHASFSLPVKQTRPFFLTKQLEQSKIARELKDLYPQNQLLAPRSSKLGTEWLLAQAILHDIRGDEGIKESIGDEILNNLRPDTWGAEGSLWS